MSAGGLGVLLYYIILYTFTDLFGVWYMTSALTGSIINWSANFFLQKFWAFENKDTRNIRRQFGAYVAMAVGLFLINLLMLYTLVEYFGLWYLGAQVLTTIILTIVSYFVTRQIFSDPIVT